MSGFLPEPVRDEGDGVIDFDTAVDRRQLKQKCYGLLRADCSFSCAGPHLRLCGSRVGASKVKWIGLVNSSIGVLIDVRRKSFSRR